MGFWGGVKKTTGFFFNFKIGQWLDYDTVKGGASYFFYLFKSFFQLRNTGYEETFEEAKDRLQLSDNEIELQSKNYLLVSVIFFLAFLSLFCYTAYLVYNKNRLSAALSGAITIYALSFSIRHHFWYFQLRQKKLGCTLSEWFRALFHYSTSPKKNEIQSVSIGSESIVRYNIEEKETFTSDYYEKHAQDGNNDSQDEEYERPGTSKYNALYRDKDRKL